MSPEDGTGAVIVPMRITYQEPGKREVEIFFAMVLVFCDLTTTPPEYRMVMLEEEDEDASRKDWDIAFIGAKDANEENLTEIVPSERMGRNKEEEPRREYKLLPGLFFISPEKPKTPGPVFKLQENIVGTKKEHALQLIPQSLVNAVFLEFLKTASTFEDSL